MSEATRDVTALLRLWQQGDADAMERLLPLVYDRLRRVARARLRNEQAGHTLQPTALVHEAYLRLVKDEQPTLKDRAHFFAIAARLMRQILVDHARRRHARKRGGDETAVAFVDSVAAPGAEIVDLIALDEALTELTALEPRLCQVVELKFFAGLNIDDMAEVLKVSTATIERDWAVAKAWLHQQLSSPPLSGR